jgi:eukaryotic-like serine/threonine-protein kinase
VSNPWEPRWQALSTIGQGQAGSILLVCERRDPGRLAALKTLSSDGDADCRHRFFHEAQALARVRAARAPLLLDANHREFEGKARLYLVMEYVPGPTLERQLAVDGPLPLRRAVALVSEILQAVTDCHGTGIVHRDLSPENIVLRNGDTGDPVLLDFGAAWKIPAPGTTGVCADDYIGNRFLRLPELASGTDAKTDPRSDLTLCVALLLFCLTGTIPGRLYDEHRRAPHERPAAALQEEPAPARALSALFSRGFRYRLPERWQSAEQLRAALASVLAAADGPRPPNARSS